MALLHVDSTLADLPDFHIYSCLARSLMHSAHACTTISMIEIWEQGVQHAVPTRKWLVATGGLGLYFCHALIHSVVKAKVHVCQDAGHNPVASQVCQSTHQPAVFRIIPLHMQRV